MAKKPMRKPSASDRGVPVSNYKPIPWMATPGMYIAGRASLDEADALEVKLELKWGRDRLRLLVSAELREKFDRQKYLTSQARWSGGLEDVHREAARMVVAWNALDKAATAAGAQELDPEVWEVALRDGTVAAIVREPWLINRISAEGRRVNAYTLEEVAMMISAFPDLINVKKHFPGAEITPTKTQVRDPLETPVGLPTDEGIFDTTPPIDGIEGFDWTTGDSMPF